MLYPCFINFAELITRFIRVVSGFEIFKFIAAKRGLVVKSKPCALFKLSGVHLFKI